MKQLTRSWKMMITLLVFTLFQLVVMAQDNGGSGNSDGSSSGSSSSTSTTTKSTEINVTSDEWYASPWVWAIGAAVFILLLVALLGGGRSRRGSTDSVRVTKTVERDTDV